MYYFLDLRGDGLVLFVVSLAKKASRSCQSSLRSVSTLLGPRLGRHAARPRAVKKLLCAAFLADDRAGAFLAVSRRDTSQWSLWLCNACYGTNGCTAGQGLRQQALGSRFGAIEPDASRSSEMRRCRTVGMTAVDLTEGSAAGLSHSGAAHWLSRQTQGIGIDANICVRQETPTVRLPEAVRASSNIRGCPAPIP